MQGHLGPPSLVAGPLQALLPSILPRGEFVVSPSISLRYSRRKLGPKTLSSKAPANPGHGATALAL